MEKDFHYDVIYALAKLTEIERPEIIAYASQYVDDNSDEQFLIEGGSEFPEKLKTNDGYYYPVMTQCRIAARMSSFVQKHVFVAFHFIPGDNHVTIQGRRNSFCATPNSRNTRTLLLKALERNDPYLIGIALHALGDSWSHQNFTGLREDWNSLAWRSDGLTPVVPNIGHSEAGKAPDIISSSWVDSRFGNGTIDNRERALDAAREIFFRFQREPRKGPSWLEVEDDFRKVMEAEDSVDRENRVRDFLRKRSNEPPPKYSRYSWVNEAIDQSGGEMVPKSDFAETHWYRFHRAAKIHLALVLELIKAL